MDDHLTCFTCMALAFFLLLCGCVSTQSPGGSAVTTGTTGTPLPATTPVVPDTTVMTRALTPTPIPTPTPCVPNWSCIGWSACSQAGSQTRTCTDTNACGMEKTRPSQKQSCTYTPVLPSGGPYAVKITGDSACTRTAENALNNLKYRASPDYEYFRKYVGAVNCSYSNMCYMSTLARGGTPFYTVCIASLENPPTVYIDGNYWNADPVWLAGVLVHEACHSEGYQEFILKEGADYDPSAFSEFQFERRCCDRMRRTWNQLGAPAYNEDLYRFCSL